MQIESRERWYRQPWPWILMAAPGAAVLAGTVTIAVAVQSFDGLVAEDYYKQGLAVDVGGRVAVEEDEGMGLLGRS